MRRAKSYSIVDHELLHGKYLHELSHSALALYLFLVVVGDRDGKSYYSERAIAEILRFCDESFFEIIEELTQCHLITYRRPYFWVQELKPRSQSGDNEPADLPERKPLHRESEPLVDRKAVQDFLRKLSEESP